MLNSPEKIKETIIVASIKRLQGEIDELNAILDGKSVIKGEQGEPGVAGNDGKDGKNGLDGKNGKDGRDGRDGRDGLDGKDGENGKDGLNGKDGSPDTAEVIVDKINTLPEREQDQIDVKHIKGLKKYIEEMVSKSQGKTVFVGGGTGGHVVKTYDLSPYLDGVTKTFTLPAFWRIIDVQIGTIPPLRPTIDYTSNATNFTLTFTDQIDPVTYLSQGLSAIIIYSE